MLLGLTEQGHEESHAALRAVEQRSRFHSRLRRCLAEHREEMILFQDAELLVSGISCHDALTDLSLGGSAGKTPCSCCASNSSSTARRARGQCLQSSPCACGCGSISAAASKVSPGTNRLSAATQWMSPLEIGTPRASVRKGTSWDTPCRIRLARRGKPWSGTLLSLPSKDWSLI